MSDTVLEATGIGGAGPVAGAVAGRANIFEMTEAAEDAVLRPRETGRWPHTLRAGLAARIANQNDAQDLARRFLENAGEFANLADPKTGGTGDLVPVLAFMDKVATQTREVKADDIASLQKAGIADADIVRLCELNAFLAYQLRVIAGLRLMVGGAS